jgi:ligand-binding sensor domain-containing protein/two-component sensor histidine kinase
LPAHRRIDQSLVKAFISISINKSDPSSLSARHTTTEFGLVGWDNSIGDSRSHYAGIHILSMTARRYRTIFFGGLVLLCVLSVLAGPSASTPLDSKESESYGIDFWREAEGLSQSRIRAITQTRDGYIWLGTDDGVVRFNGTGFKTFSVETGSLRDNEIAALKEDHEGGLWIGTYGGGLSLLKNGVFRNFSTADGLPDDVIMRLDEDSEGNIWFFTPNGVGRYSHGVFTKFTTDNGLSDNLVTAISARTPQEVFVATGSKMHRLAGERFEEFPGVIDEGDGNVVYMMSSSDGALWLSFSTGLVKKWKDGNLRVYSSRQKISPHISLLYEDPQGAMWMVAEKGLFKLKDTQFEPVSLENNTVRLGTIYALFMDREGSVWVGLQANGLGRLRKRDLKTIASEQGLPNDSTRSVFQDSRGDLWVGTVRGLARFSEGHVTSFTEVDGIQLGPVRSFAEDAQRNVLVSVGPTLFMIRDGKLVRYPGWKDTSEIQAVYKDQRERIWVGTDGAGLFLIENLSVQNYRAEDGLASNRVRTILSDKNGAIWVGTSGRGVSRYQDGKFTNYTTADGLAGNRVLTIYEDDEGSLWFATREGLSRLKEGRFFNYTARSGLLVSFVYTILDDGRGNFWFSCAQGLFRVSKSDLKEFAEGKIERIKSVDYGVSDGMRTRASNVGNQPAAWKSLDGSLMFSTMNGVVVVDPKRLTTNQFVPPVYIEQVTINKEDQKTDQELQLPLGLGEVEIHYAALSYVSPEKIRYRYMLEGFDRDWVDVTGRRFAYYANLAPGRYRFRVIAGTVDGAWNESGAAINFYLKPRFYQTRLFLFLVISALVIITWLLYRLRLHGLKVRYIAVLQERNRIAREIHDTLAQNLAGIALQLDSVTMELSDVPPSLRARLDQACSLTRYSLAEARRSVSDLRSDDLERQELNVSLPAIAEKMVAGTELRVSVQVTGTRRDLDPTTEKNLLRIYQEAIANSIKHARARVIEIELKYEDDCLVLRVRDDGIGFNTENIIPLGVGHYGLVGMRERAERIGGHMTLKSRPGEGTELLVELPFTG